MNAALGTWRRIAPDTHLALLMAPVSSHRSCHGTVIVDMMNRVGCNIAKKYEMMCLNHYAMLYPFADSDQTDGCHHWFRNKEGAEHPAGRSRQLDDV